MSAADHVGADREVEQAVGFVLRSTRARPQTEAELAGKLGDRGFAASAIHTALGRARELGAVDDLAFARAWVADRGRGRGYAMARLRAELARRKVPGHVIDSVLTELEDRDEEQAASELARARFGHMPGDLPPEKAAQRLVGFLARKGYPEALCRRVAMRTAGLDRSWD